MALPTPLNPVEAPEGGMARVLIVDDSIVARAAIGRMIDASGRFVVMGAVSTARGARDFLERNPVEIVLLDLHLPDSDGLSALPELIAVAGTARVVVVSATAGSETVVRHALSLGAADVLLKPGMDGLSRGFAEALIERLERVAAAPAGPAPAAPGFPHLSPFDIVGIGASTGGIHALSALLRAIPTSCRTPILITQHLPHSFTPYFAAQLTVLAGRPCDVATNHLRIRPGRIVVAPGNAHLCVVATAEGAACRLSTDPSRTGCMPSVDPMFASLAEAFGARALGVVLSGMGRDGSEGAAALAAIGANVVVQDRGSSVVWGMPGSIADAGQAAAILPPDRIGKLIAAHGVTS